MHIVFTYICMYSLGCSSVWYCIYGGTVCACGGGRLRSLHGGKEKHKYACMCVGYLYVY